MERYRRFFVVMLAVILLSSIISLVAPLFLQVWNVEGVPLTGKRIGMLIGMICLANSLNAFLIVYRERFAQNYNEKNLIELVSDFLHMEYDAIVESGPSNLLERMVTSINHVYTYMTGIHIKIWASVVTLIVCVYIIMMVNVFLGIAILTYIPMMYFGYRFLNKELARRSKVMQEETGRGFQEILSYLQEPDYYKQLPAYDSILQGMKPAVERIYGSMARVNEFAQSTSSILQGIGTVLQNVVMLTIVYNYDKGIFSPYTLMMVTMILPLYFSAVSSITNANIQKSDYRVAAVLKKSFSDRAESEEGRELGEIDSIEFSVSELRVPGKRIPFSANVLLKRGDVGQICGASGTGKSTLAKGIVRFREVDGIRINGEKMAAFSVSSVRRRIEYVSQNIPIIRGTLRENILFGKDEQVTDDEITNSFVLKTLFADKTLETEIMEKGANLSGGEKQKIALARALVSNPDVLIIDEGCSNIDSDASDEIYAALSREKEERITIVITHDALPEGFVTKKIGMSSKNP